MIKNIIKYPTPLSVEFSTDVRIFDEKLFSLIDNLKDTINENNLQGLAAFEIGNYFNVVVVKDENGDFLEMMNPRLISHSERITTQETTAYYGDISAEIQRYKNISIVYQDREGKSCSYKASDKFAVMIQRKIDYTFGATFILKMSAQEREKFEHKLKFGSDVGVSDYCPRKFKRDYLVYGINFGIILLVLSIVVSFFIDDNSLVSKIWEYETYTSLTVFGMIIFNFFYAQYEGKQYTSCSSCQLGNIAGTAVIALIKLSVVMLSAYFLVNLS